MQSLRDWVEFLVPIIKLAEKAVRAPCVAALPALRPSLLCGVNASSPSAKSVLSVIKFPYPAVPSAP
jgi:hypothetical protein